MVKVISFSLWGNNPTYNIGAIRNAEIAKSVYPDFKCWFYIHKESVSNETIIELQKLDNTKIIFKDGNIINELCKSRMWRYEAIDDPNVEIMMCRDTDTRIWHREKLAVEEWLKSDKLFHIMRDHPHHTFEILGGMFGTKKLPEISSWKLLIDQFIQNDTRMYDQDFLRINIYPYIRNNSLIHASFHRYEEHAIDFPIKFCNEYKFVGEYVYYDDSRSQSHIDCLINEI